MTGFVELFIRNVPWLYLVTCSAFSFLFNSTDFILLDNCIMRCYIISRNVFSHFKLEHI